MGWLDGQAARGLVLRLGQMNPSPRLESEETDPRVKRVKSLESEETD